MTKSLWVLGAGLTVIIYQNCAPFNGVSLSSTAEGSNYYVGIYEKVIEPKCLSCHSGNNLSGGVNLSTYSTMMAANKITAGNALTSAFYTVLADAMIPAHATLSQSQLQGIEEWIESGAIENVPPTVNAGPDQNVLVSVGSVILSGAAQDIDGTISSYLWTQTQGPNNAVFSTANQRTMTVSNLTVGSYTFRLRATDNMGGSSNDTLVVTVASVPAANILPTVNAGADRAIRLPSNSVNIEATASDSDGSIDSYIWTRTSGPSNPTINNANTSLMTVNNLVAGTYVFRITVTDNRGGSASDSISVVVSPASTVVPTFTQIRNQIINGECLRCHGSSGGRGGYNMGSYSQVITRVVQGNANASVLYDRVDGGSMPPGGMDSRYVDMIRNWINAGAPNN